MPRVLNEQGAQATLPFPELPGKQTGGTTVTANRFSPRSKGGNYDYPNADT